MSMRNHVEFFRQFRRGYRATGSVLPSSRFLAHAMTAPLRSRGKQRLRPLRILEIGPGTGAVTRCIVPLMRAHDHLDLVEPNDVFSEMLKSQFQGELAYRRVSAQSHIHGCTLQEFQSDAPYDVIVSGLPLNNFPIDLVQESFESCLQLLAEDGVFSFFEYMYVRPLRKLVSNRCARIQLNQRSVLMQHVLMKHRFSTRWVFANFPPAWVQHLRR